MKIKLFFLASALVFLLSATVIADNSTSTVIQGNHGSTSVIFQTDAGTTPSFTVTIPRTVTLRSGDITSAHVYAENVVIAKNQVLTVSLQRTDIGTNYTITNADGDSIAYAITCYKNVPFSAAGTPQTPIGSEQTIIDATTGAEILRVDPFDFDNGGDCGDGTYKEPDGIGYYAATEILFHGPAEKEVRFPGTYMGTVSFTVSVREDT